MNSKSPERLSGDATAADRVEAGRALAACADYELWAATIPRLTTEIGKVTCPRQTVEAPCTPEDEGLPLVAFTYGDSCFGTQAKVRIAGDDWDGPGRPLRLDEIEPLVADCAACSRLVGLIRERKEARKKFGAAKRRVRTIGKSVAATDGEAK